MQFLLWSCLSRSRFSEYVAHKLSYVCAPFLSLLPSRRSHWRLSASPLALFSFGSFQLRLHSSAKNYLYFAVTDLPGGETDCSDERLCVELADLHAFWPTVLIPEQTMRLDRSYYRARGQ